MERRGRPGVLCEIVEGGRVMSESSWEGASGTKWARNQARTDAQLGPLSDGALRMLELREGDRVLDVGCGTGQTLIQLRELVGQTGRVIGLDISPPMLEGARARIREKGYDNVELLLGDASIERLSAPVDAIFSRFGVMFFDDPVAAFRNLLGALRPSGRLSFICWQPLERNAWALEPMQAVREVAPEAPLPVLLREGEPGPFRFGDDLYVKEVLTSAGFSDVQIDPERKEMVLGGAKTLEEAVEFALEIGPAARMIAEVDPVLIPAVRQNLERVFAQRLTERGVIYEAATYVVTARAPSASR